MVDDPAAPKPAGEDAAAPRQGALRSAAFGASALEALIKTRLKASGFDVDAAGTEAASGFAAECRAAYAAGRELALTAGLAADQAHRKGLAAAVSRVYSLVSGLPADELERAVAGLERALDTTAPPGEAPGAYRDLGFAVLEKAWRSGRTDVGFPPALKPPAGATLRRDLAGASLVARTAALDKLATAYLELVHKGGPAAPAPPAPGRIDRANRTVSGFLRGFSKAELERVKKELPVVLADIHDARTDRGPLRPEQAARLYDLAKGIQPAD